MSTEDRKVSTYDVVHAYREVFGTPEGQIVLADLMRHFAFARNTTAVRADRYGPIDVNQMLVNEGARSVLIHIGRRLDTDPADIDETEQTEV